VSALRGRRAYVLAAAAVVMAGVAVGALWVAATAGRPGGATALVAEDGVVGDSQPGEGQVPVQVITGGATCQCRLQRYLVATITDSLYEGGTSLNPLAQVSAAATGEFLIASSQLWLTDRTGRIVRQVGQVGSGPGEFRSPQFVLAEAAGHRVFDQRLRRTTRLALGTFAAVEDAPMPFFSWHAAMFPDGRYVLGGEFDSPGHAGQPLHLVAADGTILLSFGNNPDLAPTPGLHRDGRERLLRRSVAPSGDSAVWTAHPFRYRLEKWDTRGRLLAVYERRTSWFPPTDRALLEAPEFETSGLNQPSIARLHEDEHGRLWVQITVRRRERTLPLGQSDPGPYDTIVEVLDLAERRVIAAGFINRLVRNVRGPSFYHLSYRESASLQPLIDVWAFLPPQQSRR
jgi:hypothetical protein